MTGFDLERFVAAQETMFATALAELRAGAKRGHWMWFVFPQHGALGRSDTARFYGIDSLAEARLYLAHPLLGPRLIASAEAVLRHAAKDPADMLGTVDAMKLRSSMTLFEAAADDPAPFAAVLDALFAGDRDPATLRLLHR